MIPTTGGAHRRFFSYDEANRTLPLVRSIVRDIVERHGDLGPAVARYRRLAPAEQAAEDGLRLKSEIEAAAEAVDALIEELHELGCRFKGFDEGLVDWYSYYAGRPVFLCWKLDEPEILFWHQLDAGYIGRQPIAPDQRQAFRSAPT